MAPVPDRSGLPFGARGAEAAKSGFPSLVCGALLGTFTHWARRGAAIRKIVVANEGASFLHISPLRSGSLWPFIARPCFSLDATTLLRVSAKTIAENGI